MWRGFRAILEGLEVCRDSSGVRSGGGRARDGTVRCGVVGHCEGVRGVLEEGAVWPAPILGETIIAVDILDQVGPWMRCGMRVRR
jgi:hypothetical protein